MISPRQVSNIGLLPAVILGFIYARGKARPGGHESYTPMSPGVVAALFGKKKSKADKALSFLTAEAWVEVHASKPDQPLDPSDPPVSPDTKWYRLHPGGLSTHLDFDGIDEEPEVIDGVL